MKKKAFDLLTLGEILLRLSPPYRTWRDISEAGWRRRT